MALDLHASVNRLLAATDRADAFYVHDTFKTHAHHAVGCPGLDGRKGGARMSVLLTQEDSRQRFSVLSGHSAPVDRNFYDRCGGKENVTGHAAIPTLKRLPRKAS